jgi:hypothetical protein
MPGTPGFLYWATTIMFRYLWFGVHGWPRR